MFEIRKITIIGLGLIGGSMALAFKRAGFHVTGVDLNFSNLELAQKLEAVDQVTSEVELGVKDADLVVLATPVGQMIKTAQKIAPHLKENCLITDVGSCKMQIVNALEPIFGKKKHYIGGHPMAGSEKSGMEAADGLLFENAVYVLTPTPQTNKKALECLEDLLRKIGSHVLKLTPEQHDLIVAAVSHLPHLIAVNLVNSVGVIAEEEESTLMLAAGGFRDTTRIAMGNAIIWRDICAYNKPFIKKMLAIFKEQLSHLEQALDAEDEETLMKLFQTAKNLRSQIPSRAKGVLPSIYEIVVSVPDKLGMIAEISTLLAKESINISDIEILRVRENDDGTIRVGFSSLDHALKAVEVLKKNKYAVRMR